MKSNKIRSVPILSVLLLIGLGVLIVFGFFTLREHTVNAAQQPLLDDKVLEEKALAAAQFDGLQGTPIAKVAVHMTLAEWLKLVDAELGTGAAHFGLTPDMPVYILAMRGDVISRMHEPPRPGHSEPERYDNITIVLDAITGNLMWVSSARASFSMPISVPYASYP